MNKQFTMPKLSVLMTSIVLLLAFGILSATAQLQKVTVEVDGLACPFCAYGLEKKLKKIKGLEKLEIKIKDGIVILYFKKGAKIDKELITKKVKEAGFTPRKLKIEPVQGQKITLGIKGMSCE